MKYKPLELRIKLYDEVHRLRCQGLSYTRIRDCIERQYGIKLSRGQISLWLRKVFTPKRRIKILLEDVKPSKELACIIGVIAGDGHVRIDEKYRQYVLRLKCRDFEFAIKFKTCLEMVAKCKARIILRDGFYDVRGCSWALCNLLKKPLNLEKLQYYVEYCEETIAAFLKGFFDSEGTVDKKGFIYVSNSDLELLNYVKELLLKLNIKAAGPLLLLKNGTLFNINGNTYYRKRNVYCLYIRRGSQKRFTKLIGFTIRRKMSRLMMQPAL